MFHTGPFRLLMEVSWFKRGTKISSFFFLPQTVRLLICGSVKKKDYYYPLIFMLVIYCLSRFFSCEEISCPWLTHKAAVSDFSAFNNPCNSGSVSLQQLLLTTKVLFTHWHEHTPSLRGKSARLQTKKTYEKTFFPPSREWKVGTAGARTRAHTHTNSLPSDCGGGAQLVTSGCILESVYISKMLKNYTERK